MVDSVIDINLSGIDKWFKVLSSSGKKLGDDGDMFIWGS
jgi:hypothetical protein